MKVSQTSVDRVIDANNIDRDGFAASPDVRNPNSVQLEAHEYGYGNEVQNGPPNADKVNINVN